MCATTVDRQCGSSLQAAFNGASTIQAGHLDLVVAAGIEHMTRVPMGSNLGDVGWGAVNEKIGERWPTTDEPMVMGSRYYYPISSGHQVEREETHSCKQWSHLPFEVWSRDTGDTYGHYDDQKGHYYSCLPSR